jgi:hypothetical protein
MTLDGTSDRIHERQTCPSLRLSIAAVGDEELYRARRPLGPEAKHASHDMAGYKVAILNAIEEESCCNLGGSI